MTTTTSLVAGNQSDREQAQRACLPVGLVTTGVALTLSMVGAHDNLERLVELALIAVGAAVLFGIVVPRGLRHESAGGRAIVLGVLGLLLVVPAFWSGLPVQLGVAAALLGYAGKRADTGSSKAIVGLVIGLLAAMAYTAIYVGDFLA